MTQAKEGDTVKVHYTGKLTDGQVFDSSQGREPLEFTLGTGQLIPGFEKAVVGMAPGQKKTETLPADLAYGPPRQELVFQVPREKLPEGIDPKVGETLEMRQPTGQAVPVTVSEVDDKAVTLDANHPLAGKDLVFEIELVDVTAS